MGSALIVLPIVLSDISSHSRGQYKASAHVDRRNWLHLFSKKGLTWRILYSYLRQQLLHPAPPIENRATRAAMPRPADQFSDLREPLLTR